MASGVVAHASVAAAAAAEGGVQRCYGLADMVGGLVVAVSAPRCAMNRYWFSAFASDFGRSKRAGFVPVVAAVATADTARKRPCVGRHWPHSSVRSKIGPCPHPERPPVTGGSFCQCCCCCCCCGCGVIDGVGVGCRGARTPSQDVGMAGAVGVCGGVARWHYHHHQAERVPKLGVAFNDRINSAAAAALQSTFRTRARADTKKHNDSDPSIVQDVCSSSPVLRLILAKAFLFPPPSVSHSLNHRL